jgi:hypothetical protein
VRDYTCPICNIFALQVTHLGALGIGKFRRICRFIFSRTAQNKTNPSSTAWFALVPAKGWLKLPTVNWGWLMPSWPVAAALTFCVLSAVVNLKSHSGISLRKARPASSSHGACRGGVPRRRSFQLMPFTFFWVQSQISCNQSSFREERITRYELPPARSSISWSEDVKVFSQHNKTRYVGHPQL